MVKQKLTLDFELYFQTLFSKTFVKSPDTTMPKVLTKGCTFVRFFLKLKLNPLAILVLAL